MIFLEKIRKIQENIEILDLSQMKEEKLFNIRTKLAYYTLFEENLLAIEMKEKQIYL